MRDVCLDEQLLLFMEQLEALEEKRLKLNSLIEEGWFLFSQARYSMGNKQVSSLQYASEMEPLVYVEDSLMESGAVAFKCNRVENKIEELNSIEDIGAKEGGLRRRINAKLKENNEEETSKQETELQGETKAESPTPKNRDPLKWFGILVPQHLRQAQAAFRDGIILSAEIASVQSAIMATRKRIQAQMKEKQESLEKAKPELTKE